MIRCVLMALVWVPALTAAGAVDGAPAMKPQALDPHAVLHQALADFDAAVRLRDHGGVRAQRLYQQAAEGFESLITTGVKNGRLYYNLANAQLRLGRIGPAIVNYRRALRLMPGDENIRRNLAFARTLCEVRIPPKATSAVVETILFWHFETAHASRVRLAVVGYASFWLLMTVGLFVRRRAAGLVWTTRAVGVLTLVMAASVTWDGLAAAHRDEGVLIADHVVLRKGNGDSYDPELAAPLSEGVEFRVIETREDLDGAVWYYVTLPDGTGGWLRSDQAELI
ncbi:MAG: hypothetical protein ACE5F9_07485 [Phycisphaerae bacterium]